jgi:hypothetical protein
MPRSQERGIFSASFDVVGSRLCIWFRMEPTNHKDSAIRSRSWLNRSVFVRLLIHSNGNSSEMKMTVCAGAVALATLTLLSSVPASRAADGGLALSASQLSTINIARIKSVLHLTAEQQRYWPPVETALHDLARQQAREEPAGLVRRISRRMVSIVLNSAAIERLAVAARPLIAALDNDQKQAAAALAQEMGLGPVVAALN